MNDISSTFALLTKNTHTQFRKSNLYLSHLPDAELTCMLKHIQALQTLGRLSSHTSFHSEAILTFPTLVSTRTVVNILLKKGLVASCFMDSSCPMTLVPHCQTHAEPQFFFPEYTKVVLSKCCALEFQHSRVEF